MCYSNINEQHLNCSPALCHRYIFFLLSCLLIQESVSAWLSKWISVRLSTPLMVALRRQLCTLYTVQKCTKVNSSAYTPSLLKIFKCFAIYAGKVLVNVFFIPSWEFKHVNEYVICYNKARFCYSINRATQPRILESCLSLFSTQLNSCYCGFGHLNSTLSHGKMHEYCSITDRYHIKVNLIFALLQPII